MPMICEVCGSIEDAEEMSALAEHLHVCSNCMLDRHQPETAALRDEEK